MQGATRGGKTPTRTGVDARGAEVNWRILVSVRAANAVRVELGRRRSGQAGYSGRAAQVGRITGQAECGSGGDLRAAGSGQAGYSGRAAQVGRITGQAECGSGGDLRA